MRRTEVRDGLALPTDRIICGDSRKVLKTFPENSIHLIISDIPYGIALDEWDVLHKNTNSALLGQSPAQRTAGKVFRRRGKPINGWSDADKEIPREYQEWVSTWAAEWHRVLKPGGSAIVFAGRRYAARCIVAMEEAGFNFRDMLSWYRPRAVHKAQRANIVFEKRKDLKQARNWLGWRLGNLRPNFEPILWFFKSYRITIADNLLEHEVGAYNEQALVKWFGSPSNALEVDHGPEDRGLHQAQKPLRLICGLIEMVTRPHQLVLVPFAGSGTSGVAAKLTNRKYILIEQSDILCNSIKSRMANPVQLCLEETS